MWRRTSNRALALSLAVLLAGATPAAANSGNPLRLHQAVSDYQATVNEAIVTGALTGCVSGLMLSMLANRGRNGLAGCLVGGTMGGIGGAIFGTNVAEAKQRAIRAEDGLDGAIAKARSRNAKLAAIVRAVNAIVEQRRSELAALQASATTDLAARQSLRDQIRSDIAEIDAAIEAARKNRDIEKEAVDQLKGTKAAPAVNREVGVTLSSAEVLTAKRAELAQIGRSV